LSQPESFLEAKGILFRLADTTTNNDPKDQQGSVSLNKPTSLDFASAFANTTQKFDLLETKEFVAPIIPYDRLEKALIDPNSTQHLDLNSTRYIAPIGNASVTAFNTFNDTTSGVEDAYPMAPVDNPYTTLTKQIVITQPRKDSPFYDKMSNYVVSPEAPFSSTIAPQRLASDQVLSYLFRATAFDKQRRYLNTGAFQAWMLVRRGAVVRPGVLHTLRCLKLYKYAQVTACVEFANNLGITQADFDIIKEATPVYYNRSKLIQTFIKYGIQNHQMHLDSFLYLNGLMATNNPFALPHFVVYVDVSNVGAEAFNHQSLCDEIDFQPRLFFLLLASQHSLEDVVLTRVLYPTTFPRSYYVRTATGQVPAHDNNNPDTISCCRYNSFDHLCYLMDSVNEQIPDMTNSFLYGGGLREGRLFSLISYYMRALTVSFLGLPFPRSTIASYSINTPPAETICSPFIQAGVRDMFACRWRFVPWELLVALGGTSGSKLALGGLLYATERSETDAKMRDFQDLATGYYRPIPTSPNLPYVVPTAMYRAGGQYNYRGISGVQSPITTDAQYENFVPYFIAERRGETDWGVLQGDVVVSTSVQDFRRPDIQNFSRGSLGFLDLSKIDR
jgi:hypothetical protein